MRSAIFHTIILLLVLFCALVPGAAAAEPASATSPTEGTIKVLVHPGSGTVCVDTRCTADAGTLDQTSSTSFSGLSCGSEHSVRVSHTAGYADYTDSAYVDYNCHTVTRMIELSPLAAATTPPTPARAVVSTSSSGSPPAPMPTKSPLGTEAVILAGCSAGALVALRKTLN